MSLGKNDKRNRLIYSLLFSSALVVFANGEVVTAETAETTTPPAQVETVVEVEEETSQEVTETDSQEDSSAEESTETGEAEEFPVEVSQEDEPVEESTEADQKREETADALAPSAEVDSQEQTPIQPASEASEDLQTETTIESQVPVTVNEPIPETPEATTAQEITETPETATRQQVTENEEVVPPEIMVTEILPNTNGSDEYEYFEVTNTTDSEIDLNESNYTFTYGYTDDTDTSSDVPLTFEDQIIIDAQDSIIFWLSYQSPNLDSFARSEQDFRDQYPGISVDTPIYRITGQTGMANGGGRSIRVFRDGELDNWSYYSQAPGIHRSAHFAVPTKQGTQSMRELYASGDPSPGAIAEEQFTQPVEDAEYPEVMVTEIVPDTESYDNFEFFEITNTTDQTIDFDEENYDVYYGYTNTTNISDDKPLTADETVILAPYETAVFWLSYTSDSVDSFAYTEQDFRNAFNMDDAAKIYRVTGQAGMANGGDRSVRIYKDGELNNWSYYPSGSAGVHQGVSFQFPETPEDRGMAVYEAQTTPTPGTVHAEQFTPAEPEPEIEIEAPLTSAPLVITEVLPDTENINGSDAYEFIEIANVTDQAIDFGEFKINYLYPDTASEALWPSEPADVIIPAGETLVFWIKNGNNNELTADDFNTKFGTDLVLGQNLVEIYSGGMANNGARGLQIQTNSGIPINRVFYNLAGKDVTYEQPFVYMADEENLLTQIMLGTGDPTPGSLENYQAPQSEVELPENSAEPVIEDQTPITFDSQGAFELVFNITDDMAPTTVTLVMQTSGDAAPYTYNLEMDENGQFTYRIEGIDLLGKDWIDYQVEVSDGDNIVQTEVRRLTSTETDNSPVRINVTDGDWINGRTPIIGASDSLDNPVTIYVNGEAMPVEASLEANPIFVMEVTATDDYFKNGVIVEDDLVFVFDEGTYNELVTMPVEVSQAYIDDEGQLVVSVYAGTKAYTGLDPNENNDDFDIIGMRLILPDGRTLYPTNYPDPSANMRMGDSAGKYDYFDFIFDIPADAFTGSVHFLDTTQLADGVHEITVENAAGDRQTVTVNVDNTGPEIATSIENDTLQKGEIILAADFSDSGIGFEGADYTLNGEDIVARYVTSSTTLPDGQHQYVVTAYDALGNTSTQVINFIVPVENPTSSNHTPEDGAVVENDSITLEVDVEDATDDVLDVIFKEGYEVAADSEHLSFGTGTVNDALDLDRVNTDGLTDAEQAALDALDGESIETDSVEEFPYHIFEVELPESTVEGSKVRVNWDGHANGRAQVRLYVLNENNAEWVEVDRHLTQNLPDGETEYFTLEGLVEVNDYATDGNVTFLVQHSLGYAGPNYTTRDSEVVPNHPDDQPRDTYDFTIAWETDTQYYNEEFYEHQIAIHDFILDQRENMNIQYVFHTGDIVDDYDQMYQWENADDAYILLDHAGIPYGVLAGNHDVGNFNNDFSNYSDYFGADRFADNPWYGGSYQDNRGHYDLISAGGIDFIMLYMGWEPGQEELDWINDVLAAHPERVGVINVHEFLQTTGGLGQIPQAIMDQVVAENPNVKMVLSGHYHDAYTRTDEFDDDGDGTNDRTVTSMLFDYQGLPEGGQGFLRLFHFDNENERMIVRTYSEPLYQYNSNDPSLMGPPGNEMILQEFEISYDQLGINPQIRTLGTDGISFEILTDNVLGVVENVQAPDTVAVTIDDQGVGELGWYVQVTDDYGGEYYSPVQYVNVVDEVEETPTPEEPGRDDQDRIDELEDRIDELGESVQELENNNADLAQEVDQLRNELAQLQEDAAVAQERIQALEDRIRELEEQVANTASNKEENNIESNNNLSDDRPEGEREDDANQAPSSEEDTELSEEELKEKAIVAAADEDELPQTGSVAGNIGLAITTLLSGLGLTFGKRRK